jgi:DNA anti-recombination protein RmuC
VGTRLEQAQSAHNGAFQKLSKGSGNLISQAEKLRQLSSVETPLSVDPVDVEAAVESHENDESPLQISNSQTTEAEDGDSSTNLPPQ